MADVERTDQRSCGCRESAIFALTALIVWPAWVAMSGSLSTDSLLPVAIAYPFVVIGAGVAGKIAGMLWARYRATTR